MNSSIKEDIYNNLIIFQLEGVLEELKSIIKENPDTEPKKLYQNLLYQLYDLELYIDNFLIVEDVIHNLKDDINYINNDNIINKLDINIKIINSLENYIINNKCIKSKNINDFDNNSLEIKKDTVFDKKHIIILKNGLFVDSNILSFRSILNFFTLC